MCMAIARENAERGLRWMLAERDAEHGLDIDPDRIDIDVINVASCEWCPLGQASRGDYADVIEAVSERGAERERGEMRRWQRDHGFMEDTYVNVAFVDLDDAWREVIREYRLTGYVGGEYIGGHEQN